MNRTIARESEAQKPAGEAPARLTEESDRQRRFYETILSSTPDLVYVFDLNHRFTYANSALLSMWGRTWDDAIGKNCLELGYEPWHAAMHDREIEQVIATRQPIRGEVPFHGTNGRRIYDYIFVPVIGVNGEVEAVAGTTRDVTERKQSEEALRESAERVRFMAESMPQKIFETKPNGDVDYLNQQWMTFTGMSLEQLKNKGWRQLVHPNDLGENIRLWQHSLDTGEPFQFIHRLRRADGAYRWHLTRIQAMRDKDGQTSTWIGSSTDIHEEKEIEEDLRRANESLNQFAFAASHDLQEPLRMIASYSQLLVRRYDGQLDDKASAYVGYITEGTSRMRDLLSDLLSYTGVSAEREEPVAPVDFTAVCKKAAQNLQAAIAESGADVSWQCLPVIHGHEAHFLQLLQNLIGNAIKYRGERPPRIHISAEKRNEEWHFSVADNGIGIASEYQRQIFGVFKRLHGKKIPGTGIGLAICQRVVERYGGRIWVESEPDKGATFRFTLPAGRDVAHETR